MFKKKSYGCSNPKGKCRNSNGLLRKLRMIQNTIEGQNVCIER